MNFKAFLLLIHDDMEFVLSNQNSLKLKNGAPLKQFFNINLGIGIIKKLLFLFIFLTYLPVFLLKFRSRELVGYGIKFCIQRVPTRHTFDGPRYPKNNKYLKKRDDDIWTKKTVFFYDTYLQIYIKKLFKRCSIF